MKSLLKGKCPKCETGDIFKDKGNLLLLKAPVMHHKCDACGYRFEKEPGYFIGSLYVSYALGVVEMLLLFLAVVAFLPVNYILALILIALVAVSFFNFRYARIIWIWIFQY
ncbi:MAG: DUF983 domain-containing protein [Bacteroidota bacterium]